MSDFANVFKKLGIIDEVAESTPAPAAALTESFELKRVHVGYSDRKMIPGLKGKTVFIKNEDPIIESLIEMLGLDEEGKVKRFGNAYVLYNDTNKHISFFSDEADVPKED